MRRWRGAIYHTGIRHARAQYSGFPRRYTVIRYRIADRQTSDGRRTRKSDGDHDYVGLAQARPNYRQHMRNIIHLHEHLQWPKDACLATCTHTSYLWDARSRLRTHCLLLAPSRPNFGCAHVAGRPTWLAVCIQTSAVLPACAYLHISIIVWRARERDCKMFDDVLDVYVSSHAPGQPAPDGEWSMIHRLTKQTNRQSTTR